MGKLFLDKGSPSMLILGKGFDARNKERIGVKYERCFYCRGSRSRISDFSHQLKMPLAALNINNGLLQDEAEEYPSIKEFAALSEQELDRIEILVQSLLTITKLDAGSIVIEKDTMNY